MSDFESPFMRDVNRLSPSILIGLLVGMSFIVLFIWPFGITEFCNHGMVTTQGSIIGMIMSDLTGVCF